MNNSNILKVMGLSNLSKNAKSLQANIRNATRSNDTKQYVKTKLKQSGDFYIPDSLLDRGSDGRKENEKYLESFINMIKYNITENYAKSYSLLPAESSEFINATNIFSDMIDGKLESKEHAHEVIFGFGKHIQDNARIIKEKFANRGTTIMMKAATDTNTVYFTYVSKLINGGDDVLITAYDNTTKICTVYMMGVNLDEEDLNHAVDSHVFSPIYISPKTRFVEDAFKDPNFISNRFLYGVSVIDNMLEFYVSKCGCGDTFDELSKENFFHSSFEMNIINRLFNSLDNDLRDVVSLSSKINKQLIDKIELEDYYQHDGENGEKDPNIYYKSLNDLIKEHYIPEVVKNPPLDAPVVDFSFKEVNFIRRFLSDYKVFDDNGEKNLVMSEVFKNPRYGNILIMPVANAREGSSYAHLSYEYNEKEDKVLFIISYRCNEDFSLFITYSYCNVSDPNWNLANSMICRKIHLYRHTQAPWPQSLDAVYQIVPAVFNSEKAITNILQDLLDFFTIIYLRPDRSKVIRETTRTQVSGNDGVRKNNKKYENKPRQEFLVRRILKDTKSAKEYISRMVTEGAPNREYTLEEWDRKGYRRRKPNSEETIWIEPTTCHRRLPLSDKEVHIKL